MPEPPGTPKIAAGVYGDFHQPCFLAGIAPKVAEVSIGFEERFLNGILRQRAVMQVRVTQAQ